MNPVSSGQCFMTRAQQQQQQHNNIPIVNNTQCGYFLSWYNLFLSILSYSCLWPSMRQRQGQELESKEGKFDVEHCSKSRNLIFTKFPVLHVTVFAVTRLSRGEEGNFKSSPMVTLIYKIYLMYIEEKRTSLKISSLMGDFKDLCKKNKPAVGILHVKVHRCQNWRTLIVASISSQMGDSASQPPEPVAGKSSSTTFLQLQS